MHHTNQSTKQLIQVIRGLVVITMSSTWQNGITVIVGDRMDTSSNVKQGGITLTLRPWRPHDRISLIANANHRFASSVNPSFS
jgi:hypothetical protein